MNVLSYVRNRIFMFKTYIARTISYIALMNAGMILFLFLSKLKEKEYVSFDIDKYFIPIMVVGVSILLLIGWFEIRLLRGVQEENIITFKLSPPLMDLSKKVNLIYDKLVKEEEENEKERTQTIN